MVDGNPKPLNNYLMLTKNGLYSNLVQFIVHVIFISSWLVASVILPNVFFFLTEIVLN